MLDYKYINLPINVLENNNITKESFMQDSEEAKKFLEKIFSKLPPYLELKNTFLVHNTFILELTNKTNFKFDNDTNFALFTDFISNTKFYNQLDIHQEKKEISIAKDISPIFYNLLYEFLI